MRTPHALVLVLAAGLVAGVFVGGCDEKPVTGAGGNAAATGAPGGSKSMLGKTRDMAKGVVAKEGERQAAAVGAAAAMSGETVAVGTLAFPIPDGWRSVTPGSPMRAAEMRVGEGDSECLVTFSIVGGGAQANLERWKSQMKTMNGEPAPAAVENKTINGMSVITIKMEGVINDAMSGIGTKPDYMLRGAVVDTGERVTTIKMTGPVEAMRQAERGWVTLIAGMQSK